MITHEFLDELETFSGNCKEAGNEKLMERVIDYLTDEIKGITTARKFGKKEVAFVLDRKAASRMRLLRDRADHFSDQEFREHLPDWISEKSEEIQLIWIRAYRAEFKKSGSHAMAKTVAQEIAQQRLDE